MKLLFDENLSYRLCLSLADIYPDSQHVNSLGLERATDIEIFNFAKDNNFIVVSKDSDFNQISTIKGYPPYIIWLKIGNVRVRHIAPMF
ncbi:MAG: hypothetical protein DRQ51_10165 [Gammaproteobacteria bacterium]|nr:MAG: hypothetical protein DRQ51_10165 [Gammaproteobacteria bacterium]